jgi:hypothetical protein
MRKLRLRPRDVRKTANGPRVLDPVRKQLVPDGPEEHVRQSVLWALVHDYGYPATSLLSEELVQRGTKNRDRADVLVRLPTSAAKTTFRVVPSSPEERVEPSYSAKIKALAERIGSLPAGIRPFVVPDEMLMFIDGQSVPCRVLGFAILEGEGHGLALRPHDTSADALGLPPVLGVLLSGYGRTEAEVLMARSLGLRQQEWTYDSSLDLAQAAFGVNPDDLEAQVGFELVTLSEDGRSGYTLMYAHDEDAFGVLMEVNLDECQAIEEERATDLVPGNVSVGPGDLPAARPGALSTIAVVECKAPGVALTKNVTDQAERYASKLGAWFVAVTNGLESHVYRRTNESSMIEVTDLPTFEQVCADAPVALVGLQLDPPPPRLPLDVASRPDCLRLHRRFRSGTVGQASPAERWLPILALDDALLGASSLDGLPFERHGVHVIEDLGVNPRNPGSAVGASWPGLYRDLLIEAGQGEHLVLGFSILGAWQVVDRARASLHTRQSGESYLIVAAAEGAEYESVLQFPFDRGLKPQRDGWDLVHDGRLTAGKGAVRRAVLFEAVRERLPILLGEGGVALGSLPHGAAVDIESLRELIARLAVYALVRRAVKRHVKAARKRG